VHIIFKMNYPTMRASHLVICALTFIILSSCAFHAYNWQGSDLSGRNKASFTNFNGKTVSSTDVPEENSLLVSYKITVTSGTLKLYIENREKRLWEKEFSALSDTAEFRLPAETGKYKIVIQGKNAAGSFDVDYKTIAPRKIGVTINKNIELFGLMLQLDMGQDLLNATDTLVIENRRATWRDWYAQGLKNYLQYRQFDSSEMMGLFRNFQSRGFFNDFFISFLLQVDEVPSAKINGNTDKEAILGFSPKGDWEEAKKNATEFLNHFNSFYKAIEFDSYLSTHKKYYDLAKHDVAVNLPDGFFVPVMESFYQKSFDAYFLVPSLNIPTSMGFGKTNLTTKTIYNAFGPFSFQSFDTAHLVSGFDFPERIEGLSVHEFGHSFVNPAIDKLPAKLVKSTQYLYTPIKSEMSKKAYTSWVMCLYEHFVKAGEIIITRKLGNAAKASQMLEDNVKAKFIYLPDIVQELEKYDKNKSQYKSYDDFVPAVVEKLKMIYRQ
jgi:hypothetical protein